jgi:ubiquinone/menaquinone biosynthesis C-methylase UbiE
MKGILHRLAAGPAVYDWVQWIAGSDIVRRRLQRRLLEAEGATVLDVGAGTGLYAAAVPDRARYVAMDNDPRKLTGLSRRDRRIRRVVLGDAVKLAFLDHSVDYALCVHVAHHLDDLALAECFRELARVVRRRVLVQEPLWTSRVAGRLLWRMDRGSYPRTPEALVAALEKQFRIEHVERYSMLHDYALVVATPRA